MLLSCIATTDFESIDVISLNIRFDDPHGQDAWTHRKASVIHLFYRYRPAFIGIQEGLVHQVSDIDDGLAGYHYIGVGRDDGAMAGEYSAVFYDTTRFICVRHATFWLSQTPSVPSTGWDAMMPRICTYGLFQERNSDNLVLVFNTHFDHVGKVARTESARLIVDEITRLAEEHNAPVILMGDFNAAPEDTPIVLITSVLKDVLETSVLQLKGPPGTFNAFSIDQVPARRIDYIFAKGFTAKAYAHLEDKTSAGRWISDHLPVLARLEYVH